MTTRSQTIRHKFEGGWATDFGPTVDVQIKGSVIAVPFLLKAENVFYQLDGGPMKIGGTERLNSSAVASGAKIRGIYDYWKQGFGGTPSRRRILHAGSSIYSDNDDNIFSTIFTGHEDDSIPSYSTFDDLLIISSSSNADVPASYDQVTAQNLAGTPPNFAFSTPHAGRLFASGDKANPSTLYYTNSYDPEDWLGAGSGSILIKPNDGDEITGIKSYKNELWIFKGPHKGSIHRLSGRSPGAFALDIFVDGLGAAYHNSIFEFSDDLGFVSQFGTIHGLKATSAYGDFNEAALSRPIHEWLREHLNINRLKHIWAVNDPLKGRVLFTISIDANQTNNIVLAMDYRFNPVRWSSCPAYIAESMAFFTDTNAQSRVMLGGTDGFLSRSDVENRSINITTGIPAKVTSPHLNYGNPMKMKTISQASVAIAPRGNYTGTFGWQRDARTQQTQTFSMAGGDVLAPSATNQFTLGTSTLSGNRFVDRFMELEEGGEFRSISYEMSNNVVDEDMELHGFSATIKSGATSTELD